MQTDRDLATILAKARTPAGFSWGPLAFEIEAALSRYAHLPRTNPATLGTWEEGRAAGPLRFDGTMSGDPVAPFRIGDGPGGLVAEWVGGELVVHGAGRSILALKPTQTERLMRWLRPTITAGAGNGTGGPLVAPPGDCDFCDRRRHYNSAAMRQKRGKTKTGRKRRAIAPKETDDAVR
jgi:hypothetical protein